MIVNNLLRWFESSARDLPWRRTRDPYAIWISEVMLQQTTVKTVIPYWVRWMRELPDVQSLAEAGDNRVHKLWEGLGYYTRVRNLQKAARQIVTLHGGVFPRRFADILALPGIGRYTAGAIASIAFNDPKPILDGNIIRVLTRLYGIAENPRDAVTNAKLWALADALVTQAGQIVGPSPCASIGRSSRTAKLEKSAIKTNADGCQNVSRLNQSLMELGALVCTPRQPACGQCPICPVCAAHRTNRVAQLPYTASRPRVTPRHFVAFIAGNRGRLLVRQRPAGVVNALLWEFPNREVFSGKESLKEMAAKETGFRVSAVEPLLSLQHSITRYRITLDAVRVSGRRARVAPNGALCRSPRQLEKLAFTGAHRKILKAILQKKQDRLSGERPPTG